MVAWSLLRGRDGPLSKRPRFPDGSGQTFESCPEAWRSTGRESESPQLDNTSSTTEALTDLREEVGEQPVGVVDRPQAVEGHSTSAGVERVDRGPIGRRHAELH